MLMTRDLYRFDLDQFPTVLVISSSNIMKLYEARASQRSVEMRQSEALLHPCAVQVKI
jgi:hypothetical protein